MNLKISPRVCRINWKNLKLRQAWMKHGVIKCRHTIVAFKNDNSYHLLCFPNIRQFAKHFIWIIFNITDNQISWAVLFSFPFGGFKRWSTDYNNASWSPKSCYRPANGVQYCTSPCVYVNLTKLCNVYSSISRIVVWGQI